MTYWLIHYEDADIECEVFTDEACALGRASQQASAYSSVLFVQASELFSLRAKLEAAERRCALLDSDNFKLTRSLKSAEKELTQLREGRS